LAVSILKRKTTAAAALAATAGFLSLNGAAMAHQDIQFGKESIPSNQVVMISQAMGGHINGAYDPNF